MVFEEIIVLVLSILIAGGIIALIKFVFKKDMSVWTWIFPISMLLGYALMFFTTGEDSILMMLKENLIWAFIISMIYINFKFLITGTKNRVSNGKNFMSEVKSEIKKMKPSFKRKDVDDEENMDSNDTNDKNE
jgi:hypothetical protein